jgi:glycosyltransferase involved in cell wall biosynthesis
MKTSVFIGIPCYGDVKVGTADSLFLLAQTLAGNQIASKLMWAKSPYVGKCRNMLVSAFLKSGAEYLLFIDADVEFYPEAVMKMINSKKKVVCTLYRVKKLDLVVEYPIVLDNKETLLVDDNDMMKIKVGPAGLMLIHRSIFETLIEKHPELKIKNDKDDPDMYDFFNSVFKDGYWYGEDVSFCHMLTKLGIDIYANIGSETVHHGNYGWRGKFKDVLRRKDE